ncbi:unnamed protein product [Cuscuta campestris]|uniref:NADH dehydrogenase (Ubiquinone) complex I, assembly factor 6 n=1 Tax=Cuscuta campestris TaxID=132261 RepID=A0A484NLU8_9ASTE|nr:unnamed protein product [Cuscuta campestris]
MTTGASSSSGSLRAALSYCVQQVRNYDYHHYLCLLELPPTMRKAAFALRAFNVETSRAMDVSSDPNIGLMRLLWWQEALEKLYANKQVKHPVAQALASVVLSSETKISKSWLKRSVEARIKEARREQSDDSSPPPPTTLEELERYAEDTASTILYSTLQTGGIRSTAADHAASHIGKANGLLLLLRSLPYHARRNRLSLYIPADMAEKHGGQEGIIPEVVFDMASVANRHLQKARELRDTVPAEARPVLLPAVPAQFMLDSLRRVGFDVFDPRLTRGLLGAPPLLFQLQLKWHSWRGKY